LEPRGSLGISFDGFARLEIHHDDVLGIAQLEGCQPTPSGGHDLRDNAEFSARSLADIGFGPLDIGSPNAHLVADVNQTSHQGRTNADRDRIPGVSSQSQSDRGSRSAGNDGGPGDLLTSGSGRESNSPRGDDHQEW